MNRLLLALVFLIVFPAQSALAHRGCSASAVCSTDWCGSCTRFAARHDAGNARLAITTQDGDATLILTSDVVAVQLSEAKFREVIRKLRDEEYADDNPLARVIKTAVLSSVRSLLNHSAEVRIRDLRDVVYEDGRLVFITESGQHVFRHVDVGDRSVLDEFSESDARAFVREFHRVKGRLS